MVTVTATSVASPKVFGTAAVTLDSGVRVTITPTAATIGTGETFQFSATVTGSSNTGITWLVNSQPGGNASVGTITSTGLYSAPASAGTFTVAAEAEADTTQLSNCLVTIVAAAAPVLSSITPTSAPQGAALQFVYLTGTSFFSTNQVLVNGTPVTTTFISTTFLKAEISANLLGTQGAESVVVQQQNGAVSTAQFLNITAVRPAIISSSPASATQGDSSVSVGLDGGYYSSSTAATFNGQARGAAIINSRQLNVGLSASDTATPGLYSLVVQNTGVPAGQPSLSAVNFAVDPAPASIPTAAIATIPVATTPSAVAVNPATGIALVASNGATPGTLSLIDLTSNAVTSTIPVGNKPTSIAVDSILDEALVVNNLDNTLSIVDLAGGVVSATVTLPSTATAYSVGVNSLTHRALVANQSTNAATIIDLTTSPPSVLCVLGGTNSTNSCTLGGVSQSVSTGIAPAVAIEPSLNWAVVTPGSAGTITIVDLGTPATTGDLGRTPNVIATLTLTPSTQGVAINTETKQALLTDPNSTFQSNFSLLDQTVTSVSLDKGEVAAAINSLTNVAVLVNSTSNAATLLDLRTLQPLLTTPVPVGVTPVAVDVDPISNEAVVANSGSSTVSILSLGPIRALQSVLSSPITVPSNSTAVTLSIVGGGFQTGSVARLDQVPLVTTVLPAGCTVNCRQLSATIPAGMLTAARRYVVDVQNTDLTVSNVSHFTVVGVIPVGNSPGGIAVDADNRLAVVTNTADNTINIINLDTASAGAPIAVGSVPTGVATISRLGRAIVTNFASNSASIVDTLNSVVLFTVPTATQPMGTAVQPDTALGLITNSLSNNVTSVFLDTGFTSGTILVDMDPVAVAVDPIDNVAAVANATQNSLVLIDLTGGFISGRVSFISLPTDVTWDPVSDLFIVANSLQNNILTVDPLTFFTVSTRVGINPQSISYNFQTATLATYNNTSHTLSLVDYLVPAVKAVVPVSGSAAFSVAIDPNTNTAVVADQANNRVLLVPLPM
jgi:DNA-binding beta-propeller fold protein YncE